MLAGGAEVVLIDGAADRRAASSPAVSDGLVMSTGAAFDEQIEQVVTRTRDAVDLVRVQELGERSETDRWLRAIARSRTGNALVGEPGMNSSPCARGWGLRAPRMSSGCCCTRTRRPAT
jgi:hypothetical protein